MKTTSPLIALTLVCFALLTAPLSRAQAVSGEPPVLFRTLALAEVVSGIFYDDVRGRPVQLMAGSGLSAPYVCPPGGLVSLYREEPPVPPETTPRRVPVAEARLGKGGPWLLLLARAPGAARTEAVQVVAIDDSWTAHPVGTIRVFNYLKRRARAAVKIGGEAIELSTGGSHIFPYPGEADQSWVQVALQEEDGWVLRAGGPQATIPNTRATLVLADSPPTPFDPDPRTVLIRNLIEAAPPPPPGPGQAGGR
jgi:hypothetical protein